MLKGIKQWLRCLKIQRRRRLGIATWEEMVEWHRLTESSQTIYNCDRIE